MSKLHIGTMGWSYDFWVGSFYPYGLVPGQFLAEYSKHFSTVEVDRTFYGIPYEDTVLAWRDQTPADFTFAVKFPRVITHEKMLNNCEQDVARFIERISQLKGKLGPFLLQFPYGFKPELLSRLRDFLPNLPKEYRYVVEVRNRKILNDRLFSFLTENGVALAWVDTPLMPKIDAVSADFVYIRWEGDRRKANGTLGKVEVDRTSNIKEWAEKIRRFTDAPREVFGYFSKYYSGSPPSDAKRLLEFF